MQATTSLQREGCPGVGALAHFADGGQVEHGVVVSACGQAKCSHARLQSAFKSTNKLAW